MIWLQIEPKNALFEEIGDAHKKFQARFTGIYLNF